MTFPRFRASSDFAYWPDYATAPQTYPTAGSLSDNTLVASIGTDDGQLMIRTYNSSGALIGSADLDVTGWQALAPCRVGDGTHIVQAFSQLPFGLDVRFICYNPISGTVAWDTTATSNSDQTLFWTHAGIAYYGDDTGTSALRFDAATGARLADAPAVYGEELQHPYEVWDVLDHPYPQDQVITVPTIGPYSPGYVMAQEASQWQAEGGGCVLYGLAGGVVGGIAFGPSGRTAIGIAGSFLTSPDGRTIISGWQSAIILGGVTPPLRKIQRSDGLALGAPRRIQTSTVQSSNRRFGIR